MAAFPRFTYAKSAAWHTLLCAKLQLISPAHSVLPLDAQSIKFPFFLCYVCQLSSKVQRDEDRLNIKSKLLPHFSPSLLCLFVLNQTIQRVSHPSGNWLNTTHSYVNNIKVQKAA